MDNDKEMVGATASFGIELADISHEMNNVLTLGIGHLGSLKTQIEKGIPDKEKTDRSLSRLAESMERLKLISDQVRKIRARNSFETISIDLSRITKNWVNVAAPSFNPKGLDIKFNPSQEKLDVNTSMAKLIMALTDTALKLHGLGNSRITVGVGIRANIPSVIFMAEELPSQSDSGYLVLADGLAYLNPAKL